MASRTESLNSATQAEARAAQRSGSRFDRTTDRTTDRTIDRTIADTVIVSAFGRGEWLASELAGRGFKVTLVDVTASMGEIDPEDAEGPFGFLEAADLLPSQKTRLTEEGEMVTVPSGLTLLLKGGPIEFRSELTSFHLKRLQVPAIVEEYLRHPGLPDKQSERVQRGVAKLSFRENWIAQLAHQLASTRYEENHLAIADSVPLPVFAPFSIRQISGASAARGFKACQASGVKIRQRAQVRDLRLDSGVVDAIEIHDDQSGVERGRTFVWMLSSVETQRSRPELFRNIFLGGIVKPEWIWTRFRIDFRGEDEDDQIPPFVVLIEDPFLAWTHANVIVLRKRALAKTYDAWVRIPGMARGDVKYFEKVGAEIQQRLSERLPLMHVTMVGLPMDANPQVGPRGVQMPNLQPVFGANDLEGLETLAARNLFYCGPEHWKSLDWTGRYRAQLRILTKLEELRAQWLAEEAKEREKRGTNP